MAQALTVTMSNPYGNCKAGPNKITLLWTSAAAGGTCTYAICTQFNADRYWPKIQPLKLMGHIVRVVTNPSATAPTDNYDITLLDKDGVDVASGNLVNRDTGLSEQWIPDPPVYIDSEITLTITNAGNDKIGTIEIFMKDNV